MQWGLVWTVLEEPLAELPVIPWFDEEGSIWGHGRPFEVPVGLGLMIENFRDVAHFAFVHRDTLGPIPEVVETLEPDRNGSEVRLRREMAVGPGGEDHYGALPEIHYLTVAPNLTSAHILTDKGERGLIHVARANGPSESTHYWFVMLGEGFEERDLKEAISFEESVYAEDLEILTAVNPRELSLDPNAEINTLADRYTLAYRQAFADFVQRSRTGRQA
jgi:phenylpropionate dioxygenase-like ring-hydroxylating dioxygenase large terminal subunit